MSESRASSVTIDQGTELVRSWRPEGEEWARALVVHGIGEHSGRYERLGSLLADAGIAVEALDLIGHGGTDGRRVYIEDWSELLAQVERHVQRLAGDRPLVLIGHSLGGLLALEHVLSGRQPQPSLLVVSAVPFRGGRFWQRPLAAILARVAPRLPIPQAITGDQLSRDPEVGKAYFADPLVYTKATPRFGDELFRAMSRVRDAVISLPIPTLVLHGGSDTLVPPQASAFMADVPGAERRLYPTLRHEIYNEPEGPEIIEEVIDWIQGHLTSEG